MSFYTLIFLIVMVFVVGRCWRYFQEFSEDLKFVALLEPWYWFVFMNLILSAVSINYDYQFALIGLLIQTALSAWFSISIGWIIQSCPHKTGVLHQSVFIKGKVLKYCYRCGTRIPKDQEARLIKDNSWQSFLFQMPPHLFEYVGFWVAQDLLVLTALFFVLRFFKTPDVQHEVVMWAVILVIFAPPAVYSIGRFRRYLSETKGLIWWEDLKSSVLSWVVVGLTLWVLVHFFL